jgi:hypothetical protein
MAENLDKIGKSGIDNTGFRMNVVSGEPSGQFFFVA